ncbi:C39 family peptidase, partial [Paenibacillus sp. FSL H7-0331]
KQKLGETLSMAFPLAAAVLGSGMNFSSFYTGDSSKVAGGAVDKPPVKVETRTLGSGNNSGSYDTSGTQNKETGPKYNHAKDFLDQINYINDSRFGNELTEFVKNYELNKEIYERISQKVDIPPQLIAAIHYRESVGNFNTYLHNGQQLGQITTEVPRGKLFYDFEEAAVDALLEKDPNRKFHNLSGNSNDLVAMLAYAEAYNGWGYLDNDRVSPYVYNGTNVYEIGKYTEDRIYDPNVIDEQPGVYILLKALESTLGSSNVFTPVVESSDNSITWTNPNDEHMINGVIPVNQIPFSSTGCAIASFTMLANFYGAGIDFNIVSRKYAPGNEMNFPKASEAINLSYNRNNVGAGFTKENVYECIKSNIDQKLPCIISTDGYNSQGHYSNHFAVVIGYTNDGNNDKDIIIMDPWGGTQTTLDNMQIYKNSGKILSVREFISKE